MKIDWDIHDDIDWENHFLLMLRKSDIQSHMENGKKIVDWEIPERRLDQNIRESSDLIKLSPSIISIDQDGTISIISENKSMYYALESIDSELLVILQKSSVPHMHKYFPWAKIALHEKNCRYGIKYLYGKFEYLSGVISGEDQIRLTDINYYSKLENKNIRDDESEKVFFENPPQLIGLSIDGVTYPKTHVNNISISIPTRRCHCLCLSNKKNDDEIFERFKADVCIEIDVDVFLNLFEYRFLGIGVTLAAKNITYFKKNSGFHTSDQMEAVFIKDDIYEIESEFRIAMFYPYDADSKLKLKEQGIEFKVFGEFDYITLGHKSELEKHSFIENVHHRKFI